MDTHLFTPRTSTSGTARLRMHSASPLDLHKAGHGYWRATMTDQTTDKEYKIRGASCNLPHYMCDAVIIS